MENQTKVEMSSSSPVKIIRSKEKILSNYPIRKAVISHICQISFTKYRKQKLASCVRSIIPNFLAGFVQKSSIAKIMLFGLTSVNFGLTLNVTTLIILILYISKL